MDLWPYVNGKAITLGLTLGEMSMSQMLDVIHFFYEEDSRFSTVEEAEAVSELRSTIYGMLYGTPYKYKIKTSRSGAGGAGGFESSGGVKPYIPPTDFDADSPLPFGDVLESPLG